MVDRLNDLQSHYALFLLKTCFTVPKLIYFMRTVPTWRIQDRIDFIDNHLKEALVSILNIQLDENQWTKASFPVRLGGLGIRKLKDIAFPAFLASTHSVKELLSNLIDIKDNDSEIPFLDEGMQIWNESNESLPINPEKQKNWDIINIERISEQLKFKSDIEKFRFHSLQNQFSGAWLTATLNPNLGTLLNNDTIRTCVGLRLGSNICQPHSCSKCGSPVDSLGRHGLSCLKNKGKYSCHFDLNRILQQSLSSINVSSRLEPVGMFRKDGKRADGITNIPCQHIGKKLFQQQKQTRSSFGNSSK